MALKQKFVQKLFNFCNSRMSTARTCRISSASSSSAGKSLIPPNPERVAPDPGDESIFRRFLQRRPLYLSAAPGLRSLPTGEKLLERLRGMDIVRDRIQLDGLVPPETVAERKLTVEDARKVLRVSQMEVLKSKLRRIGKSSVSYGEFVQICNEECANRDQALDLAKVLDDSGTVIVLGNLVFLKPEQGIEKKQCFSEGSKNVVKAIHGLMPSSPLPGRNDPRMMEELEEMEAQKAIIDRKADSMVRRELWGGLAYLVVQTAAFMRLTFWELSWDVMEPICFYVTSMYFMGGYAFFLRTSKEPSFEGFFESRFSAKQKKLMKSYGFDMERYNQLREACYPHPWPRENDHSLEFSQGRRSFT